MNEYPKTISDPLYAVGIVSFVLVFAGVLVLKDLKPESPLIPYVLQILGLTFILPVVLLMAVVLKLQSEAVVGLLGTIIGYIFGTSRISESLTKPQKKVPRNADDRKHVKDADEENA